MRNIKFVNNVGTNTNNSRKENPPNIVIFLIRLLFLIPMLIGGLLIWYCAPPLASAIGWRAVWALSISTAVLFTLAIMSGRVPSMRSKNDWPTLIRFIQSSWITPNEIAIRDFVIFLIGLPFLVFIAVSVVALIYAAPALAAQIGAIPVGALVVAIAIVALALVLGWSRYFRKE